MSEEIKQTENETTEIAAEKPAKKKGLFGENTIEILVAIFLGITAILTAWASWIGSLHGGNQATNYTKSNNLASEGNSEYNAGLQQYLSDLMVWNTIIDYTFDQVLAESEGDEVKAALIEGKLDTYLDQNGSEILAEGVLWMNENGANSPFEMPGIFDLYFVTANELLQESRDILAEGQSDNAHGDAYNLVNVIYSVVLFMLGIVGIFKALPCRTAVLIIAVVGLVLATIYMFTIPLPTGFNIMNFFSGS